MKVSSEKLYALVDEYIAENSPPEGSFSARQYLKHYNKKHDTSKTAPWANARLAEMVRDGKLARTEERYSAGTNNKVFFYYQV